MGWLWSDTKPTHPPNEANIAPEAPSAITQPVNDGKSTAHIQTSTQPQSQSQATKQQRSTGEEDSELQRFLAEFSSPAKKAANSSSSDSRARTSASAHSSSKPSSAANTSEWEPSSLYPSTMSCTSAWDQAFFCQMLGGQFSNYYRYGTLRDCSELWSNFWFCTQTNRGFMGERERERRIQTFYRKREERLKQGPSSEDIWEARSEENIREWAPQHYRWDYDAWKRGEKRLRDGVEPRDDD